MSNPMDEAVQALRSLPENMQAVAARAILDYAASYEDERSMA